MHHAPDPENDDDENNEDLIFATESLSLRTQRKQIRAELTDPYCLLLSGGGFHKLMFKALLQTVSESYPDFAVIPNLRCGQWYVDPKGPRTVRQDVYFKSTDGHIGVWSFNLRRPNLGLLDAIQTYYGVILVDSTRRGKRFPDALSKTIPIWCSVINRAIVLRYGENVRTQDDLEVWTASSSVSESERSQIRLRLQGWAEELAASTYVLPNLQKPLRPLHISPSSRLPGSPLSASAFPDFYPVICLSASRYTSGGSAERHGSFNYVPGSGDDHEGWTPSGFTPQLYWANRVEILATSRQDLPGLLQKLAEQGYGSPSVSTSTNSGTIWIGKTNLGFSSEEIAVSSEVFKILLTTQACDERETGKLTVYIPQRPKSQHQLYSEQIDSIMVCIAEALNMSKRVILVLLPEIGDNGKDFAIGVALAILATFYDESQEFQEAANGSQISKHSISQRLEWLIASLDGSCNPSRAMLKRVNSYLFSR